MSSSALFARKLLADVADSTVNFLFSFTIQIFMCDAPSSFFPCNFEVLIKKYIFCNSEMFIVLLFAIQKCLYEIQSYFLEIEDQT